MIEEHDYQEGETPQDLSIVNGDPAPEPETRSTQIIPPQSTLQAFYNPDSEKPRLPRIKHHTLLGDDSIALYIGELDEPLVVEVKDRITLGRYGPYSTQPSLDLAPYGAFERGVSRLHATIYRQGSGLVFEDMDSNNGSYINAERIAPQVPHGLQSGDVIVLGSLTLEIYFKAVVEPIVVSTVDVVTPEKVSAENDNKKDAPAREDASRTVQAIKGTIQAVGSSTDAKEASRIDGELAMYIRQSASGRQSLEIIISADLDAGQEKLRGLLQALLKSQGFELKLK